MIRVQGLGLRVCAGLKFQGLGFIFAFAAGMFGHFAGPRKLRKQGGLCRWIGGFRCTAWGFTGLTVKAYARSRIERRGVPRLWEAYRCSKFRAGVTASGSSFSRAFRVWTLGVNVWALIIRLGFWVYYTIAIIRNPKVVLVIT